MKVEFKAVARVWGDQVALRSVDLTIESGERVALLGPSGSGKTTVLRLIAGALRANRGSVVVDGADLDLLSTRGLRAHRRRTALLSQSSHCVDELTVHANVVSGMVPAWPWYRILASSLSSLESKAVAELLEPLGVGDRQWDLAATLSGGQRQRVAIARALAASAELLLLDEPTSALDPQTAGRALASIAKRSTARQTLVVSTHRAGEVREHVDRVIGLRDGRVTFDCATSELDSSRLEELYSGSRELAV